MYREFLYEMLLSGPLLLYSAYLWYRLHAVVKKPTRRSAAVFAVVLSALYAGSVIAGVAVIATGGEPATVTGLGALSILLVVWLNFMVTRAYGK